MKQNNKSNWLLWVLLIFLPPFGILYMWIAKKELSQKKKKTLSIVFAIWFLLCMVIGGNEKTTNTPTTDNDNSIATTSNNESKQSTNDNDIPQSTVSTYESQENIDTPDKDKVFTDNFLFNSDLTVKDVMNGSGDTVLGQYAFIRITDEQLEKITPDMLKDFAESVVNNSGYNWVSIMTHSDTGICFSGSDISSAFQGKLDKDGSILDADGMWVRDKDGNYSYSKKNPESENNAEYVEESSSLEETETSAGTTSETVETVPVDPIENNTPSPTSNANNFDTHNNTEQQNTTAQYVLNTNSRKIHYPSCKSVPKISPNNYETSNLSLEQLLAQGYTTCGNCFK